MANRYQERFSQLQKQGRKAFIPFTMLGWPDRATCLATVETMLESGVSALELGIAFSDPVADGPVIQQAAAQTIGSGFSLDDAFEMLSQIRKLDSQIPIGLLVYYNSILSRGQDVFFKTASECGADSILIADATPDVVHGQKCGADSILIADPTPDVVYGQVSSNKISNVCVVSPLTDEARLDKIIPHAGGFIYAVSRLGVTGVEERYDLELKELISRVKQKTRLPLCVGFGISNPEQASEMFTLGADGVVTGSKIIQIVAGAKPANLKTELGNYLNGMLKACYWRPDYPRFSSHQQLSQEIGTC